MDKFRIRDTVWFPKKKDFLKIFSWSVRYHTGNAKKDKESAEYHDKMAVIYKAKIKELKTKGE